MKERLGNSIKIFEKGHTTKTECPNCKCEVEFSIFSNRDTKLISEFPLIESENIYLFLCPKCYKTYTIKGFSPKSPKEDEAFIISKHELVDLKKYL